MEFDFSDVEGWSREVTLRDGTALLLRAERPEDLEPLWEMYSTLSEDSLSTLTDRYTHDLIERWFRSLDFERILPILAFPIDEPTRVVAHTTLHFSTDEAARHKAMFGVTVHDDYQGRGLGTLLTRLNIEIAGLKGLSKVYLHVLTSNVRGIHVYEKCGFEKEGLLRKEHWHYLLQDYVDEYRMSILL
jgi:RimJ/RimL family protein N-acetyltransferase